MFLFAALDPSHCCTRTSARKAKLPMRRNAISMIEAMTILASIHQSSVLSTCHRPTKTCQNLSWLVVACYI